MRNKWAFRGGIAVVVATALFAIATYDPFDSAQDKLQLTDTNYGQPLEMYEDKVEVFRGVLAQELPPETISADFLWGAGKFAVFEVRAPADRALRVEEIVIHRVGGNDEILPSVWVRLNRKRVYAETAFENGKMEITRFPDLTSPLSEEEIATTVLDGFKHKLMNEPRDSFIVEPNGIAIVELFGNIGADAVRGSVPINFCLDEVSGVLLPPEQGEEAGKETLVKTSLNKTCWPEMTVVPAQE